MSFSITYVVPETEYEVGGSTTTEFEIPWPFDETTDVFVAVGNDTLDAADFEITGTENALDIYPSGTVTLDTGVSNTTVRVYRATELEQKTVHQVGGSLKANSINREVSRIWMALQDLRAGGYGTGGGGGGDGTCDCPCIDRQIFLAGKPAAGQLALRYVSRWVFEFLDGLEGCGATAGVAATSEAVIKFKAGGSLFATLTFGVGETEAVGALLGSGGFNGDDVLTIEYPDPQDATLADIDLWVKVEDCTVPDPE